MPETESLVIFGQDDIVSGFKALGFTVYAVKEPEEFKAALSEAVNKNAQICLVQDAFYRSGLDAIQLYKGKPLPVVIPFSPTGKSDLLNEIVGGIRLKATGVLSHETAKNR
jgi:vacuolar-type H+-ATPase subunit F/Vma7